jgi:hypothetical protein
MPKRIRFRLAPPTPALVQQYLALWQQNERYRETDAAIRALIDGHRPNQHFGDVLVKTSVINDLYGTNIFGSYAMARHIHALQIDGRLVAGDIAFVPDIAQGNFAGNRFFYSFATKYCNWHQEALFPIYDCVVESLLWAYKHQMPFGIQFRSEEMRTYQRFKEIVDAFILAFALGEFTYKEVDKFLWKYGKEVWHTMQHK